MGSIFHSAFGKALFHLPLSPSAINSANFLFFPQLVTSGVQIRRTASRQSSETTSNAGRQPVNRLPLKPPLPPRHGRKTPNLLPTLRYLNLASDIPYRLHGKTSLSYNDYRKPIPRSERRKKSKRTKRWSTNAMSMDSGLLEVDRNSERRFSELDSQKLERFSLQERGLQFKRRQMDEELCLASISRKFLTSTAALPAICSFSPFSCSPNLPRIIYSTDSTDSTDPTDPDIVTIEEIFTPKTICYLNLRGYDPWDVLVWCWILVAPNGKLAGLRMRAYREEWGLRQKSFNGETEIADIHSKDMSSKRLERIGPKALPVFLISFTMRRRPLTRNTLEYIISITPEVLANVPFADYKTKMVYFVRLIQRLQEEFIQGLLPCARMITQFMQLREDAPAGPTATLSFMYNRLLSLLSRPPPPLPFASQPVTKKAQFILLQKMSLWNLHISREGYQAIISTQLRRAKSPMERDRIKGMRKSWPPWQEERDAWSDRTNRENLTRAGIALCQMSEAGYAHREWEWAAKILAGKDTDSTPTVPTRSYLKANTHRLQGKYNSANLVWAARIKATRTIYEAWHCFLDARNSLNTLDEHVYFAMFEKLVFADKSPMRNDLTPTQSNDPDGFLNAVMNLTQAQREILLQNRKQELKFRELQELKYNLDGPVPGEGKEVEPPPFSPSERGVHVSVPPPSIPQLYHLMEKDNVETTHKLLDLLIRYSGDLNMVDKLIGQDLLSKIPGTQQDSVPHRPRNTKRVVTQDRMKSQPKRRIEYVSPKLLTAYLTALIRCGDLNRATQILLNCTSGSQVRQIGFFLPSWNTILGGLVDLEWTNSRKLGQEGVFPRDSEAEFRAICTLIWEVSRYMIDKNIEPDGETLRLLAKAAERIIEITYRKFGSLERNRNEVNNGAVNGSMERFLWDGKPAWERVVEDFESLIGLGPKGPSFTRTSLQGELGHLFTHSNQSKPRPKRSLNSSACSKIDVLPLYIPPWASLHQYFRLVALSQQYLALLRVVTWMVKTAMDPNIVSSLSHIPTPGERRRMRRCWVVVKLFLEGSQESEEKDEEVVCRVNGKDVSRRVVREVVKREVKKVRVWGGWATVEEVRAYVGD